MLLRVSLDEQEDVVVDDPDLKAKKLQLETAKLELEVNHLRHKWLYTSITIIASVLIAVGGWIVQTWHESETLYVAQVERTQERLIDKSPEQRINAISLLLNLAHSSNSARSRYATWLLVNRLAYENDPGVLEYLVGAITQLDGREAIPQLVELNRVAYRRTTEVVGRAFAIAENAIPKIERPADEILRRSELLNRISPRMDSRQFAGVFTRLSYDSTKWETRSRLANANPKPTQMDFADALPEFERWINVVRLTSWCLELMVSKSGVAGKDLSNMFLIADFHAIDFSRANLERTTILGRVNASRFDYASLNAFALLGSAPAKASFVGARLSGARLPTTVYLPETDLPAFDSEGFSQVSWLSQGDGQRDERMVKLYSKAPR